MAMRSIGSISSELCEMQALRDSSLAMCAKDLEWQRKIFSRMQPPPTPPPIAQLATPSPPRPTAEIPAPFNMNAYLVARAPSHPPPPTFLPTSPPSLKTEQIPITTHSPPRSPAPCLSQTGSASTHAATTPEPEGMRRAASEVKKPIGKIRRHRMTKEEEARFAPEDLVDLKGSTAAKSRKMTETQRDIMLHKRRLRNRQSAARSRDKQRKTIGDVGEEVDELVVRSGRILKRCVEAEKEVLALRAANESLRAENAELRQNATTVPPPKLNRSGSTLRISMSSDMLDKIIGGNASDGFLAPGGSAGIMRIPSKLHVSLSTDRLSEGMMPTISGSLPPLSRNVSIIERLLDYNNNTDSAGNAGVVANNSTKLG